VEQRQTMKLTSLRIAIMALRYLEYLGPCRHWLLTGVYTPVGRSARVVDDRERRCRGRSHTSSLLCGDDCVASSAPLFRRDISQPDMPSTFPSHMFIGVLAQHAEEPNRIGHVDAVSVTAAPKSWRLSRGDWLRTPPPFTFFHRTGGLLGWSGECRGEHFL